MGDEPERLFSGAQRTISLDRMQLGKETVEKVECLLKSWMRNNMVAEPFSEEYLDD